MILITLLASALSISASQDPPTARTNVPSPDTDQALADQNQATLQEIRDEPWEWTIPPLPLFPIEALNADTQVGMARLTCRSVDNQGVVSDCQIVDEMPTGQGFGASQLAAMPTGRLSIGGRERLRNEGSLTFTTRFLPPDADIRDAEGRWPAGLPDDLRFGTSSFSFEGRVRPGAVTWEVPPLAQIPELAHQRDVYDGFALVICSKVSEKRVLSECFVFDESPPDIGFGQSVLESMPNARVSEEVARRVRAGFPVAFRIRFGAT